MNIHLISITTGEDEEQKHTPILAFSDRERAEYMLKSLRLVATIPLQFTVPVPNAPSVSLLNLQYDVERRKKYADLIGEKLAAPLDIGSEEWELREIELR